MDGLALQSLPYGTMRAPGPTAIGTLFTNTVGALFPTISPPDLSNPTRQTLSLIIGFDPLIDKYIYPLRGDGEMRFMDNDVFRRWTMSIAEFLDSFRVVPRLMLLGYGWILWKVVEWFMAIEPVIQERCVIQDGIKLCEIVGTVGPNTQQAALVTTLVGIAAAVFGLYSNSGRDWHAKPFVPWKRCADCGKSSCAGECKESSTPPTGSP